MKIDTHVHSIIEKPHPVMSFDEMVYMAAESGLDGFILTEHNKLLPDEQFTILREKYSGVKIFKGIEVGCTDGFDYLVYGPLEFWPLQGKIAPEVLVRIAQQEGNFVSIAHPYRNNMNSSLSDKVIPEHVYDLGLDGVEVKSFNLRSSASQKKSLQLAGQLDCVALAGSDHHPHCPRIGRIGIILNQDVATDEELVEELKAGRLRRYDSVDF